MSRLVVVSNRVPVPGDRNPAAGGLAVALADAVTPGSLWFGWSGRRSPAGAARLSVVTAHDISYATIDITEEDYRHFYIGFANGALYPLLLYRLGQIAFSQDDYVGYQRVNETYAETLMPMLRSDDLVWIHDYQLLLVGRALRALGAHQRMGFFLHTPFPPPPIFAVLPRAVELLDGLCACDIIGFHTRDYQAAFLQCMRDLLDVHSDSSGSFVYRGRRVQTIVDPIGIDVTSFSTIAARSVNHTAPARLAHSLGGRPLGISVDRLDYAKGLPNRMQAVGQLLARYPEHRSKVTFLQIAAPSREELAAYRNLHRDLDRAVGDVNGRFAEPEWTPIRYITRAIGRATLAGYYRISRLGIVTPLRDGMNLVAKEFVAAQNPDNPGVLILSRFAGAAEQMSDALVVNPFDADETADAMHRALIMDLDERRARHASLLACIHASSASAFCRTFMAALEAVPRPTPIRTIAEPLPSGAG